MTLAVSATGVSSWQVRAADARASLHCDSEWGGWCGQHRHNPTKPGLMHERARTAAQGGSGSVVNNNGPGGDITNQNCGGTISSNGGTQSTCG